MEHVHHQAVVQEQHIVLKDKLVPPPRAYVMQLIVTPCGVVRIIELSRLIDILVMVMEIVIF